MTTLRAIAATTLVAAVGGASLAWSAPTERTTVPLAFSFNGRLITTGKQGVFRTVGTGFSARTGEQVPVTGTFRFAPPATTTATVRARGDTLVLRMRLRPRLVGRASAFGRGPFTGSFRSGELAGASVAGTIYFLMSVGTPSRLTFVGEGQLRR